jgi:hypothetical protein
MTIQEEKDRLGRLDDHRAVFNTTLLNLAGGKGNEWILRVPNYVWTRNDIIREFLEYGSGDMMEECSNIVTVLRSKQGDLDSKDDVSPAVDNYVKDLRRADLVDELRGHGLKLRNDSNFCSEFIKGTTTASVQEVGATMSLTSFLFQSGHRCWSENHSRLERIMRERYRSGECSDWYAAYKSVKPLVEYPDEYDSDNDRYYDRYDDRYNHRSWRGW